MWLSFGLIRLGSDIRIETQLFDISYFQLDLYKSSIQQILKKANLPANMQQCSKVIYKGRAFTAPARKLYRSSMTYLLTRCILSTTPRCVTSTRVNFVCNLRSEHHQRAAVNFLRAEFWNTHTRTLLVSN